MRNVTQKGVELIKHFESFSSVIYICPAGYRTIGYGHVVKESEIDRFKKPISEYEALKILEADILSSCRSVLRLINVPLTDGQFDALVSFTFNLGGGALQRSTLRRKINRYEHEEAADEFLKW
ncbi:MAG TPA: muraminidase, partial [Alphaproteobacteria bacterium]|nr:muraminidase [Alphaproteobacteria bacterium]